MFTFHLKQSVTADLTATAKPVTDEAIKLSVMNEILADLDQPKDVDAWLAGSPLVEVILDE